MTQELTLHPIGPTAFDAIMESLVDIQYQLDEADRRGIRIETRLCKLMEHSGLDGSGSPVRWPATPTTTRRKV